MLGDPCRPQAQGDRCDRRSVRPLHPAGHSRLYPVRQRTGVPRQGSTGMDRGCRCQDRLHRARQPLGERVHRELQRSPARRAARRRNLLHSPRGPNRHRELAAALQHDQAARIARIQAASSGGICPCLRRVAGCATPTGSAGHASATASLKLTFHLDHSVGANHHCSTSDYWAFPPTGELSSICSTVAFNDIKHLARLMPAHGFEAQDVVPPRCDCWVARKAIFSSRRLVFARSRAPSLAALPVITWRSRLVTVMAGLWSVVAEAVVRACLTSVRYKGAWGRRGSVPRRVSRSATAFISAIRAKFGLGVIWLSEVRVGDLFRVATPLVADRRNAAVRLLPYAIRPPARGSNLSSSAATELPSFRRVTMATKCHGSGLGQYFSKQSPPIRLPIRLANTRNIPKNTIGRS